MSEKLTRGAHHVGLSVPNLEAARDFFVEALGFKVAGEKPDYPAVFVSDGTILLTLWRCADPDNATPFDRRANVGLHHLALAVADDDALDEVHRRVAAHPGTTIEFAPEPIGGFGKTRHFMCFIPGGIRLEFATPFGR